MDEREKTRDATPEDDPTRFKPKRREEEEEDTLDEALEETFPASDPPSVTRPEERTPDRDRGRS